MTYIILHLKEQGVAVGLPVNCPTLQENNFSHIFSLFPMTPYKAEQVKYCEHFIYSTYYQF